MSQELLELLDIIADGGGTAPRSRGGSCGGRRRRGRRSPRPGRRAARGSAPVCVCVCVCVCGEGLPVVVHLATARRGIFRGSAPGTTKPIQIHHAHGQGLPVVVHLAEIQRARAHTHTHTVVHQVFYIWCTIMYLDILGAERGGGGRRSGRPVGRGRERGRDREMERECERQERVSIKPNLAAERQRRILFGNQTHSHTHTLTHTHTTRTHAHAHTRKHTNTHTHTHTHTPVWGRGGGTGCG